ncbi:MAG: HAD-IIA family hydrolase [Planctomycetota bacterium]
MPAFRLTPALRRRLQALRHVVLDLDGTLYRGAGLFPATLPFLAQLTSAGIGYTFLTNNNSLSRAATVAKLRARGLPATLEQVRTSTQSAFDFLRRRRPRLRRLLALGTASFRTELRQAGFHLIDPDQGRHARPGATQVPDAVLLAFDQELSYDRLCLASHWVAQGKPFFATHPDRVCPSDPGTVLVDCGAIAAAITAATGVAPRTFGKPDPAVLREVARTAQVPMAALAMVGDRLYTDIAMARAAGALAVLVLSGETTRAQAGAAAAGGRKNPQRPDLTVVDIAALGGMLAAARGGLAKSER